MKKPSGAALLLLALLQTVPAEAAREIIMDFDTGEIREHVETPPAEPQRDRPDADGDAAEEIPRLKRIIREQQRYLLRQQAIIEGQREEIRRQQDINRGLELLCRACR